MLFALDIDEDKPLSEQEVKAWGENQLFAEEPTYKESDILNPTQKEFFRGFKNAFDIVHERLKFLVSENEISSETSETIRDCISGDLCSLLFSIIDSQDF